MKWQLDCVLFGADDITADIEIIALAYQTLINFGASPEMFEIRVNNRGALNKHLEESGITTLESIRNTTAVIDRKAKMSETDFKTALAEAAGPEFTLPQTTPAEVATVLEGLTALGIRNAVYDASIVRGFNYYTGTIFEIFDVSSENNRSLLGGGRYDNLTGLFSNEPVSGIGFGMGDVTMRDFLETHNLLAGKVPLSSPTLMILTTDIEFNLDAQKLASEFRAAGIRVAVDIGSKKLDKKLRDADKQKVAFILVYGEDERTNGTYKVKRMSDGTEIAGEVDTLISEFQK